MKTFSKILSIALVLSMVLGFALVGTAATTDSYEKVTTLTDGQYILVASVSDSYYVAGGVLASDGKGFTYTKLSAAPGATLTGVTYEPLTVTVSGTTATLKLADGKYVNPASSGNNLTSGTTATSWNVSVANGEVTFSAPQSGTAKYIAFNSQGYWRYYTDKSSTSGYDQKFEMYKLTTGSTPITCDHDESKLSWEHDDTQHWKVCSCGAYSTAKENHDGNATCVCGYSAPAYVAIADGQYTIFAANKYLASLGATSNYGYPPASDTATSNCVYTVENASNNQFYLKDANDRYIYNTGTYKNVNASATKPTSGGLWAVLQSGSTQLLISVETNKAMQFGTSYGTFQFVDDHSTADAVTFATYTPPACVHVDADSDYLCDNGCGEILAPAADSELTVEQVIALGQAHAHNVYTNNKYYVTGTITEVYSTQYGNMYITDGNGNTLTVYGTYNYDGSTRYDSMTSKPGVGDEVTLYGIVGQFSGNSQMKNAWIDDFVVHTCDDADDDHKCDICDKTLSQCDDADNDHKCDVCDKTLSQCDDADNDHKCDVCDATLSQCADGDNDHKCDVCDATLSQCADGDDDHKCDVCDATLSQCDDADDDHKCDLCDKALSECDDADKDHKCDLCDKVLSECGDTNSDHKCDVCSKALSECKDADKDHKCDTCDDVLTECDDADNDDVCDICGDELDVPKTGNVSLIPVVIMAVLSATGSALVFKKKYF